MRVQYIYEAPEKEDQMSESEVADPQTPTLLLAWLCMQHSTFEGATLATKGSFLIGMGLSRQDAARVLGTTDNSLRVTLSTDAKNKAKK